MRRIIENSFVARVAMLTAFISVLAAVMPIVALAGSGDPGGI